ncbi:MAG TPA: rhodanese-like domain-containing protein, partial [Pyrinomonadaceae bacterium]|nr:rhodanese-like domain-containing protein [Pyrinomonadaceae bacterium]
DSLHEKLLKLPDGVEVYPAHGAGSMCGRNISKETSSTIGQQRQFNYALQPMAKEEFIQLMTTALAPAPAYFSHDAEYNRAGAPPIKDLARPRALSPEEVLDLSRGRHTILDVRAGEEFGAGHVPGSLNIGLAGQFASWAGALVPVGAPLVVVAGAPVQVDETIVRLARVGHESVRGFLSGGMEAWRQAGLETTAIKQISVDELSELLDASRDLQLVDVRRPDEYAAGHAPRAVNLPLAPQLPREAAALDRARATAVICQGGYRSSAAASLLARAGFQNLLNVAGGTGAWVAAGYAVE